MTDSIKTIYLAGGCFWGIEAFFSRVKGIVKTTVGYANGKDKNPTYEEVCKGDKNFAETVLVEYDSEKINLERILSLFFEIVDPTTLNRQAHDIGVQYRSGIYYINDEDLKIIENSINDIQKKFSEKVVTEVKKLENFYDAEEYHQKYLDKNPNGYCHIDLSRLKELDE